MNNKEFKKKYWKLPSQLRLEYAFHVREIIETHKLITPSYFFWVISIIFGISVLGLLFYLSFENSSILYILIPFRKVLTYGSFIVLAIDIMLQVEKNRKLKKLRELFINGKTKL